MPPRTLASLLMILTGAAHLLNFLALGMARQAVGFAVFGLLYLAISVLLLRPGRFGLWAGILIPAVGALGGVQLIRAAGTSLLLLGYVVVDVAVVAICVTVLVRERRQAAA